MNYLGANMKLIVECSQKLVQLGETLWGKEQKLDKEMQEHQKLCDEIMAIQGIEPIEAEMEQIIHCPEGYIFKDENGNVINATKIVLEKKKDVNLTQEQINKMVYDSCVLFCKHSGCGIPRETCTSLGTCKEHDEYRDAIRTHLMKEKKKEYPKTIEECKDKTVAGSGYKTASLLTQLERLLICRDAYWKIAGEEMGLGKPWEPDWSIYEHKFCLGTDKDKVIEECVTTGNRILAFPTEEMRDAFYENFKGLIESCKELL